MPRLSQQQRADLIRHYYSNRKNADSALKAYRSEKNIHSGYGPCTRKALNKLIHKFEQDGSLKDLPKSGRPKPNEETVWNVHLTSVELASQNPYHHSSTRQIGARLGIGHVTCWRILRNSGFHYYVPRKVHEIKRGDPILRQNYARQFLERIGFAPHWLDTILWSDEAHFTLHGQVNRHNSGTWSQQNPHRIIETPLHDTKVTVWIGFTSDFIIGPYFFEENGQTVTINSARYLNMLRNFVIPQLEQRGEY